jgi:hypothetical protein
MPPLHGAIPVVRQARRAIRLPMRGRACQQVVESGRIRSRAKTSLRRLSEVVIQLTGGIGIALPRHSTYPCQKLKEGFRDTEKRSAHSLDTSCGDSVCFVGSGMKRQCYVVGTCGRWFREMLVGVSQNSGSRRFVVRRQTHSDTVGLIAQHRKACNMMEFFRMYLQADFRIRIHGQPRRRHCFVAALPMRVE